MEKVGNEPAFPGLDDMGNYHMPGLTRREYFAAKVLNGLIASRFIQEGTDFDFLVADSYTLADKMIAASSK